MAFKEIRHKGKPLTIHKAITHPHFEEKTVLVTDKWDYIDLWLKRANKSEARFYWQQARAFYDATNDLPATAAPLTAYYCFLNATKALLIAKAISSSNEHGVTGFASGIRTALSNEKVKFLTGGILPALASHLGEGRAEAIYSLHDLLYNLVYVHRAFDLTYSSATELFIPIADPKIVRSTSTHEAWFVATLQERYANQNTINKLPDMFERELACDDKYLMRCRIRFNWRPTDRSASLSRYRNYHKRLRKHLFYIYSPQRLWYVKRGGNVAGLIPHSSLTIAFAAMHRLSELSRYTPDKLARHFDCQHNWLLLEFIRTAPLQFIDEISSELAGREFMIPGRATRK